MSDWISIQNGEALPRDSVPALPLLALRQQILHAVADGQRVVALFAAGDEIWAVLAHDADGALWLARGPARRREAGGDAADHPPWTYPSLTPECPQVHLFEREMHEQAGVVPAGHPWLKPVRFPRGGIGQTDFFRVGGAQVHEVAVGPVHAGVIEPGHFRFQCHGEEVFHLEISLGYQHRGIERAIVGGPHPATLAQMETAAGDTTIGHLTAYCQNLEALCGLRVPARAQALRAVALELERLANHTGDLGALAGDVAFLPTMSYCGRIRGDFLNLTAALCGSRFGRGLLRPGGIRAGADVDAELLTELERRVTQARTDVTVAVELLWDTPSVLARFEGVGAVSTEAAEELGLVGPAARACGLLRDVRRDHPAGLYRFSQIPLMTAGGGDVNARAYVRWLEIQQSLSFILECLGTLPAGAVCDARAPRAADRVELQPDRVAVSLTEGWRGEICHVALTDEGGRLGRYKIVDPSFHNWSGLALCLREQQISDFPLCNKSFNLSYCGYDL